MNVCYGDITLRAIEYQDLELVREMINDPIIENMTCGSGAPVSQYQQEIWFKNLDKRSNEIRFIIDTKEHGAIGMVMLTSIDYLNRTAEFHSKIATSKKLRGKGYGTQATDALLGYAFNQLNLNCVYSQIIEYNIASQRVEEKCGFTLDGILRNRVYKNGEYHNITVWSITKKEFRESHTQI